MLTACYKPQEETCIASKSQGLKTSLPFMMALMQGSRGMTVPGRVESDNAIKSIQRACANPNYSISDLIKESELTNSGFVLIEKHKLSENCSSQKDYEFGVKNGLKMAPPCSGSALGGDAVKNQTLSTNFGRAGQLSECFAVITNMYTFLKAQNEFEKANNLLKFALAYGKTAIEIGAKDGYSEDMIIAENKRFDKIFRGYRDENMPVEQYSELLTRKSDSCLNLIKSDSEIENSFRSSVN